MQPGDSFEVTCRVVEEISSGVYRVELRNGHRVVAHLPRRLRREPGTIRIGDELKIRVSPFEMADGRVID